MKTLLSGEYDRNNAIVSLHAGAGGTESVSYTHLDVYKRQDVIIRLFKSDTNCNIHIAYGTIVNELKEVSRSYKEARIALDVGKIFFEGQDVIAYSQLGIGRLIYQDVYKRQEHRG